MEPKGKGGVLSPNYFRASGSLSVLAFAGKLWHIWLILVVPGRTFCVPLIVFNTRRHTYTHILIMFY